MRVLFKILAVIVGLFGIFMAAGCLIILWIFSTRVLSESIPQESRSLTPGYLAMVALFGGLGYYFLRSAWKHLRRPELNSAINVSGSFCFILGMWLITLASRNLDRSKSPDTQDPTPYLALQLGVIVTCYLLHRLALKRIATRAFPAGKPHVTPAAISTT